MNLENERLIIIGGTAAGAKAAAKARSLFPELKISLFTKDKYISYSGCGMPYYIKNDIEDYNSLIIRTPEDFEKKGINVFLSHEALDINPSTETVFIKNLLANKIVEYPYTRLIIATGATPVIPDIEGVELKNIHTLRTIHDAINIKHELKTAQNAVIIGGGYIGMELAEAFLDNKINTTIIESSKQLMNNFDEEISEQLLQYTKQFKKLKILLNSSVKQFLSENNSHVSAVELTDGRLINADLVVIAVGIRPDVELAKSAKLELGSTGAIKVNEYMQTSEKNIFAAGDCVEKVNMITQKNVYIPLGTSANKEGKTAAMNLFEHRMQFKGIIGAAITRFFKFNMAICGLSEKEALKNSINNYKKITITDKDISSYMPHSHKITLKLIASKSTNRILGAQLIGEGNITPRAYALSVAISNGMTVSDYAKTDFAYAPPFSRSIDITLTAAQILQEDV